jgi:hypothetical protein
VAREGKGGRKEGLEKERDVLEVILDVADGIEREGS